MEKRKGYIVTHSHWDREWRYPLWENRMYLCNLIDELLEILDTQPDYASFVMDGQTVAIEDYLEVRPENTEKIKGYIAKGRIEIGPWYTLPDLYPLCGESFIRNLLKGKRTAEKLGKCTNVAYESFGWGQTAQFPQIYKGFGLDVCVVAKHVSKERAPQSEFVWEAPDGTQMLATRLGSHARANFFVNAYIKIMTGLDFDTDDYKFDWNSNGFVYHRADSNGYWNDFHKLNWDEKIHEEYIKEAVDIAIQGMEESVLPEDTGLFNGCDSTTAQPLLSKLIRKMNQLYPDWKFHHARLSEYIQVLCEKIKTDKLPVVKGELRDGAPYQCSANALATRPKLKQLNKKVQNTLFYISEPLRFMSGIQEDALFTLAEKYLLLAHPHDSINGVTQDKTVNDTTYNLEQALEISEVLADKGCQEIVKHINMSEFDKKDILVSIFNTCINARNEIVRLFLDFPRGENVWDFDIINKDGQILEKQVVSRKEILLPVSSLHTRPYPFHVDRYEVLVKADAIPAMGYKTLKVQKTREFDRKILFWREVRTSEGKEISKSGNIMENNNLRVKVNSNGTIDILDKKQNRIFQQLNYFEDTGDSGDYWIYYPPYNNRTFTSLGKQVDIWVEENGELSATIGVQLELTLPKSGTLERRSEETAVMPIRVYYTLHKDSDCVNVRLQFKNTVADHRLRVLFDTGMQANYADTAGHFGVDRRPVCRSGKFYPEMQTLPMQYFVDVNQLGIVHNAFCEYEALPNQEGTIAVTLLRGVKNMICTEVRSSGNFFHEDGGQSLGEHIYDYQICPHAGDWETGELFLKAQMFNTPVKAVQTSKNEGGTLPLEKSYLEVEGVVVSAIKKACDGNGTILRVFNPSDESKQIVIQGTETNLNEEEIGIFDGIVPPKKIVTIKI